MGLKLLAALVLTAVALPAPPAEKTARQLFFTEEATPGPAPPQETKAASRKKDSTGKHSTTAPTKVQSGAEVVNVVSSSGSAKPLGLRYSLIQIIDGLPVAANTDQVFRSGDRVRLRVEGNREGYLYVVSRGSSGTWKPLFPNAAIAGGNNRIQSRQSLDLPPRGTAFTFDQQPGEEQLFVVYSTEPVPDLDGLIYSLRGRGGAAPQLSEAPPALAAQPISDRVVTRLREVYARDLVFEKVDQAPPAADREPEHAVYVANSTGGRLVADIKLTHR